jgi:hypothetical protein
MGGILHQAGYYMGDDLYPPRNTNPKGFFENAFINGINERIMKKFDYSQMHDTFPAYEKYYSPYHPGEGHRWLSFVPPDVMVGGADEAIQGDIKGAVNHPGFAYKDPRFNYTLGAWTPWLEQETVFICLFREPEVTIQSVVTECNNADYLSDFYIDYSIAEELWRNSYLHLLQLLDQEDPARYVFVHYQQLISGNILARLSDFLGVILSPAFVDRELDRTRNFRPIGEETRELYQRICKIADFNSHSV